MRKSEDPRELELEIARAKRLAKTVDDRTTTKRIWDFIEELKEKLERRRALRQSKEEIRARAHEIWEQHGRPIGRDKEFWLQAEAELRETGNE
jgi:Protein of unknown function (DUF2934)